MPSSDLAATFADYSDLTAYIHARDVLGMTNERALVVGDNGVGKWGVITAQLKTPMVALSPEDWEVFGAAACGKKVKVTYQGQSIVAELQDTRPAKAHIHDGTVIELNPAACAALGICPPDTVGPVTWEWANDS